MWVDNYNFCETVSMHTAWSMVCVFWWGLIGARIPCKSMYACIQYTIDWSWSAWWFTVYSMYSLSYMAHAGTYITCCLHVYLDVHMYCSSFTTDATVRRFKLCKHVLNNCQRVSSCNLVMLASWGCVGKISLQSDSDHTVCHLSVCICTF